MQKPVKSRKYKNGKFPFEFIHNIETDNIFEEQNIFS